MSAWSRTTNWRQGSLLVGSVAADLNLVAETDAETTIAMAISHDCDIACDDLRIEPVVEFVIGRSVTMLDGSFTRAKNSRTLHLQFVTPEGIRTFAFSANAKVQVSKAVLAKHQPEDTWQHASPKPINTLRWWLAARYFRSSFPDSFESRLSQSKVNQRIDKLISPLGESVHGVFFQVDDGADASRSDGEPHELHIRVVYDDQSVGDAERALVIAATAKIEEAITSKFFNIATREWKQIELLSCRAISDEVFSYAAMHEYRLWRLEFRSLDNDSQNLPVPGA